MTLRSLQALPLAPHLEAKPQTGHLPGIEAAAIPVAPVAAATVTAASTSAASGQTAGSNSGTFFSFHYQRSIMSSIKSTLFSALYHQVLFCNPTGAPDTSTYQYDESSGYYYDPQTGLYYDPNSHVSSAQSRRGVAKFSVISQRSSSVSCF